MAYELINGTEAQDVLTGTSGVDYMHGNEGNDRLYGGAGDDLIIGGEGRDHLHGGAGDDFIIGDNTSPLYGKNKQGDDDHLYGGAGNDRLRGGEGDDTYHYESGDGFDTINDDLSAASFAGFGGGTDTLLFKDWLLSDLMAGSSGDDLYIINANAYYQGKLAGVKIEDFFLGGNNVIETLKDAQGDIFDLTLFI